MVSWLVRLVAGQVVSLVIGQVFSWPVSLVITQVVSLVVSHVVSGPYLNEDKNLITVKHEIFMCMIFSRKFAMAFLMRCILLWRPQNMHNFVNN